MVLTSVIFFILTFSYGYGSLCTDLSGTWKNQLNSNMTIESISGNTFTGVYHTAVESTAGAARLSSKISGVIQTVENGKLVGFNVLFNKGASVTAWVGQCIVCDGKEKIFTTWVLRSYMPAAKRWMTTRINQDTFWRPEAHDEADQPSRVITSVAGEPTLSSSEMQGNWVSTTGDSFEIKEVQDLGAWTGEHRADGENGAPAFGRFDGNQTYTAVGFVAGYPDKIKGWTGHINDPEASTKVLETSWLELTAHQSCSDPRKLVRFGMDNYSKA